MFYVHMRAANGMYYSLRFPVGTTLDYVQRWYALRLASGCFRILGATEVTYQEV